MENIFNHSYTDEQLLNLLNNTILEKTEFKMENYTGGSISVTTTYNNKFINYKVSLFFGYKNKNSIARTFEIKKEQLTIWMHAILLKTESMKIDNIGFEQDDLIRKMTTPPSVRTNVRTNGSTNVVTKSPIVNSKVDSNKVILFDDDEDNIKEVWEWIISLSQVGLEELVQGYINYSYNNQKITNPDSLKFSIKEKLEKRDKKTLLGIYDYKQRNWSDVLKFDKKEES